jgi:hypothetical protein
MLDYTSKLANLRLDAPLYFWGASLRSFDDLPNRRSENAAALGGLHICFLRQFLSRGHIRGGTSTIMGNVIELAKWKQQTGRGRASGGLDGVYAAEFHERSCAPSPQTQTSGSAARTKALWRDIRRTGTSLAEDYRVFVYAGELSGQPDDVSRDLRTLRAAFESLQCGAGRAGSKGFHVLLGNSRRSEWVNDDRYGLVLTLAANFAAAEAALLIEERLRA